MSAKNLKMSALRTLIVTGWLVVAGTALLGSENAYAGGIYKWTDESGVVVFTDVPPKQSGYERVNLKVGRSAAVATEEQRLQNIYQMLESCQGERDAERKVNELETARLKDAQKRCAYAREELSRITGVRRIAQTEDAGELTVLDSEARDATVRGLESQFETYCLDRQVT